jgi:hypothetical protein
MRILPVIASVLTLGGCASTISNTHAVALRRTISTTQGAPTSAPVAQPVPTPTTASVASPRSSAVAAASAPSGEDMPVGDLPGWRQIYTDDFTTAVPLGNFPTAVAAKWNAYPWPWKDTSGHGINAPLDVDSIAGGVLTQHVHSEGSTPYVSAIMPKLSSSAPSGQTYGRYAVRFRADPVIGYKVAWMLWPDSENQPQDGEIDFPETNLTSPSVWAFVHRTANRGGKDQASFNPTVDLTTWHTAVIEWTPNQVVFLLDGAEVGRTFERVPSTPMHWVLQTETAMDGAPAPTPEAAGDVQIDWVAAWAYDTSIK